MGDLQKVCFPSCPALVVKRLLVCLQVSAYAFAKLQPVLDELVAQAMSVPATLSHQSGRMAS
jgi:hypothetical protein